MSFILSKSLLLILFYIKQTRECPTGYNNISNGCYKIFNNQKATWSDAQKICANDTNDTILVNANGLNITTHLVALESYMEKNSLSNWMKAYGLLQNEFWTDGILSTSSWNWSNQSILWYFKEDERAITGNGTNYKFLYNPTVGTYQISDDIYNKSLNFICEYPVLCTGNSSCQNDATCISNVGQDVCLCAPGFTGISCETDIDECLSSPCLHNGNCIDAIDNYTCNCSTTFYEGQNCEIPKPDPTISGRFAAFWSVLGIVSGLVVLLTLSDLPWEDILTAIGCSCNRLTCCSKQNDPQPINDNDHRLSDSPTDDQSYGIQRMTIPGGSSASKGMNYHVMNTVWDNEYVPNQTPTNPQYNGYRSPDQYTTFNSTSIQSFTTATPAKQVLEDKRVYSVNIKEPTSKTKDPTDTMVNWTQQLQEQLKTRKARETSASSTKQLIHSTNSNDY